MKDPVLTQWIEKLSPTCLDGSKDIVLQLKLQWLKVVTLVSLPVIPCETSISEILATYYPNSKLSHSSAVISCETFISEIWQQQHKYYHSISVQSCHHHQPSHRPLWSIHFHQSDFTTSSNRNTVSTQGCHHHRPSHHPLRSIHFHQSDLSTSSTRNTVSTQGCHHYQPPHHQRNLTAATETLSVLKVVTVISLHMISKIWQQQQKHCQCSKLSP